MKRLAKIVLLLASALLALACGGAEGNREKKPLPPVRAALGVAEKVEVQGTVELAGTVQAGRTVGVSSRVAALVTGVRADVGDAVRRGQVLVEIDPQTTQGQLAQARGALAQAEAGLALARRNLERFEALAASDSASQLELDMARTQYEQARGAVEQARGAVGAASSVAAESRVVAPFAGRVAARMVEVGDLAAPGRPLLTLESAAGTHRLAVAVPESSFAAARLALGARVPVRLDARPDLGRIVGTVAEISPAADPMAHAFTVEIDLGGADVASGAVGRVQLPAGAARQAVAVPAGAVLRQGGLALVVVRDPQGRALSRAVTLGSELPDGRVEVISGLAGGETLLVGLAAAPPLGSPVEATGAAGEGVSSRAG